MASVEDRRPQPHSTEGDTEAQSSDFHKDSLLQSQGQSPKPTHLTILLCCIHGVTFFHVFVAPVFLFLRTGVNLFCVCVYKKTALSISDVLTLHACVKIHTLSFWSLSPTQPPVSPLTQG